MSTFEQCSRCGIYGWVNTHKCPPKWEVKHDDEDDDEAITIHAMDAREAAEKFTSRWDECSELAGREDSIDVRVRLWGSDEIEWAKFRVQGMFVTEYSAMEADD